MAYIHLVLPKTNDIVASYESDYVPPPGKVIKVEDKGCSCSGGFSYTRYKILDSFDIILGRNTINNQRLHQKLFIDVELVKD